MRFVLSITGNVLLGAIGAVVYIALAVGTGTGAVPAVLGGLVMGALTFIVVFIATRAMDGNRQ